MTSGPHGCMKDGTSDTRYIFSFTLYFLVNDARAHMLRLGKLVLMALIARAAGQQTQGYAQAVSAVQCHWRPVAVVLAAAI